MVFDYKEMLKEALETGQTVTRSYDLSSCYDNAPATVSKMRWVVNFVRHAMRPSELINPVAFVQMLPGRCTPVQLAAAACCKKFLYIQ